jgi:hypothetical protein
LPLLLTERTCCLACLPISVSASAAAIPCGWALLLSSLDHCHLRPRLSVPGRLTTLFYLPQPPSYRRFRFPHSALPPTKSRGRIPPPSHPASAQHASIRRNRPSILDPLHSALLLLLRVDHSPPPSDAPAIILIRLPTHFASGARLFCLHPRTAASPALSLPASRHPVVHITSLPRPPPPLLLLPAACTPHSPVSR